jgi:hypothetical protein
MTKETAENIQTPGDWTTHCYIPVGHWRNKGGNQKFLKSNENENQPIRTHGTQQRLIRGEFIAMSAYTKNRESSNKWPNGTSQTSSKTRTT